MKIRCTSFFLFVLSISLTVQAEVSVPSIFSDHMVLQREAAVPVWGTAAAGETVTVHFAEQNVSTKADGDGAWRVQLKSLKASKTPQTLTVEGDKSAKKTAIENVLVGDVWVGSGQSNMAGRVASYAKNDETLDKLAKQAPFANIRLMQSGPKPTWSEATPEAVISFSALHFPFGERLQRELDVPVGLIVGAVGGTPSGYWIPPETYASSKLCKESIAEFTRTYDREAEHKRYEANLAAWEKLAAAARAEGKKPRGRKPGPPAEPGQSSRGGQIGGLYERYIQPVAGYRIRGVLWDQGEARSGVVGVDQYIMMTELIRGWRDAWGQGEFPFLFVQKPSGGGNAFAEGDPITRNADPFASNLPDINRVGTGEQRFLYVRLMRDVPNAWMVPASDLGSGIHPTNKWGYGNRAAEVALSQVYKTGIQAYGPIYRSHTIDGNKVIVHYDQVGQGLVAAHIDELHGFALAGDDGQWHWADARIDGDTVVLSADDVPAPTRVRYAYTQVRTWANLFNKDGLPALTFDAGD